MSGCQRTENGGADMRRQSPPPTAPPARVPVARGCQGKVSPGSFARARFEIPFLLPVHLFFPLLRSLEPAQRRPHQARACVAVYVSSPTSRTKHTRAHGADPPRTSSSATTAPGPVRAYTPSPADRRSQLHLAARRGRFLSHASWWHHLRVHEPAAAAMAPRSSCIMPYGRGIRGPGHGNRGEASSAPIYASPSY
ncbi:hypothetical protein OF83DRAFT_863472 [Amylostereum chailletii]|nr:hypothetical protein OF83DRAFT_863472 [Amylostereum chailletii]